jgi:hypothetical protein
MVSRYLLLNSFIGIFVLFIKNKIGHSIIKGGLENKIRIKGKKI